MTQNHPGATATGEDRRERAKRRWSALERFLALLVALLGVGTAYLTFLTATANHDKNEAQTSASDSSTELTSAQKENARLKATVADLQKQLGERQSPTTTGTTPAGSAGTVRHSGTLTVTKDVPADLDAPATDPQWTSPGPPDLAYPNEFAPTGWAFMLDLHGTAATYETCRTTTGYAKAGFKRGDLVAGQNLCVETSDKRFTAMKVTRVDDSAVTMEVTTYEN
jgi:cell division protein FtsB